MSFRHLFPPLPTTPAEQFSTLINMLIRAIIGRTGASGLDFATVQSITRRVLRLSSEIRELVAALRAGTLRIRRSPAPGLTRRPASVSMPDATVPVLPRRFGWLQPLVPCDAAMAGHNLLILLAEPDMAALLAASPRLVRSVRSLCWMLGARMPVAASPVLPAAPLSGAPRGGAGQSVPGSPARASVAVAAGSGLASLDLDEKALLFQIPNARRRKTFVLFVTLS